MRTLNLDLATVVGLAAGTAGYHLLRLGYRVATGPQFPDQGSLLRNLVACFRTLRPEPAEPLVDVEARP